MLKLSIFSLDLQLLQSCRRRDVGQLTSSSAQPQPAQLQGSLSPRDAPVDHTDAWLSLGSRAMAGPAGRTGSPLTSTVESLLASSQQQADEARNNPALVLAFILGFYPPGAPLPASPAGPWLGQWAPDPWAKLSGELGEQCSSLWPLGSRNGPAGKGAVLSS